MVSLGWWHWLKLQAFWQALSDCFREGLVGGASSCVKQSGVPQIANSIGKMMIKHQILELYLFQRTQLSHPHLCDEGRRKPPSIIGIRNWPTHVEMPVPCWKKTQLRTFTVLDPRIRSSSQICGWKGVKTRFPADSPKPWVRSRVLATARSHLHGRRRPAERFLSKTLAPADGWSETGWILTSSFWPSNNLGLA